MSRVSRWSWTLVPVLALAGCGTEPITGIPDEAKTAVAVPRVSFATVADPDEFTLYAGKTIPVGTVEAYNDATTVYVSIELVAGWCMTESHVAVAAVVGGIPQSNGNPVPGKFPYGDTYPGCDDQDSFEIPLPGVTPLVVAVHAKVWEEASETIDTYSSSAAADRVYGPLAAYTSLNGAAWGSSAPTVAAWVHGSWPGLAGAQWISSAYATNGAPGTEDHVNDTWRQFRRTINVPGWPVAGEVASVTSDNAEEAYLNGVLIGSDGEVQGAFIDNAEWGTLRNYPFSPVMGNNLLEFIVRNYGMVGGTPESNPTGLIYRATVAYYAHGESAWAGTTAFAGKNWATYFTYAVTHGVMSNQNSYGAEFVYGATARLKFIANAGTSGNLGFFEWRYGPNPASPIYSFDGTVYSATKDGNGVWAVDIDVTGNVAGGIDTGCNIRFWVKDAGTTGDLVLGWLWLAGGGCGAYGAVGGPGFLSGGPPPFTLTTGSITEY